MGAVLANLTIIDYLAIFLAIGMHIFLCKTTLGFRLRAIGINQAAARSLGTKVERNQFWTVTLSGIFCGLGGVALSMGSVTLFIQNITAGRGYMAMAACNMGNSNPLGVLFSSFFFGACQAIGIALQNTSLKTQVTAAIPYAATALSCLEYLRCGITTYADLFYFADTIAHAAQSSGLRCFPAASVFTNPSPETDDSLGAAVKFIQNWKGSEEKARAYLCIGPHAPYSISGPLFKEITELSRCYDLLIHTHISETQDENNQIREQSGMSPTQWLESLGVFERPTLASGIMPYLKMR